MIKTLAVKNFRGIKSLSVENLKQFNLLAGKNNSGKTSLIESLFIWANASLFPNYHFANSLRGFNYQVQPIYSSFYQFFYGTSLDNSIIIETLDDSNGKRKIEITGKNPKRLFDSSAEFTTTITEGENSPKTYITMADGTEDARGNDISIIPNQYTPPLYDNNLPQKLTEIIINKQKDSLIKTLQSIDSSIQDFQMVNGNVIMFDVGKPQLIRYEIMGDGIKKITSLLVSVVAAKNGILLIDEFENGLHHSSMNILWKAIFKSALENNVQVFATTHSYECIQSFYKVLDEINNENGTLIRIERKNDEHNAVNISKEDAAVLLGNNWEIR